MNRQYGAEILGARSKRRLHQGPLASRLRIHKATLVDIERGRIEISERTYRRILAAIEADDARRAAVA